jgi:negative regulator of genetic competence, sporulation and motility
MEKFGMKEHHNLTLEHLKIRDVLVYIPNVFTKIKKGDPYKVYVVTKIKDETENTENRWIICDILEYGNPHYLTQWTQIIESNLKNYIRFKDLKKDYPQYFI